GVAEIIDVEAVIRSAVHWCERAEICRVKQGSRRIIQEDLYKCERSRIDGKHLETSRRWRPSNSGKCLRSAPVARHTVSRNSSQLSAGRRECKKARIENRGGQQQFRNKKERD